ncbi:MAG: glycosyltransferase family 2 protein [Bacteroidaceae bacterium]|nr:glycosyltransferase family 2 protein [Bacteroidaceae bacterium]MBR4782954.1 glycosyltransferase family 2 protein [Bacteroidaceae bacterium]
MIQTFITFYGYLIFFYSLSLILSYVLLLIMAYRYTNGYQQWTDSYMKRVVDFSPFTPGVSIVAPAYNEEVTVVDNVHSLLAQDYPNFEVIIVNDGSKDKTLEKLIENFELVEVPYEYVYKVNCKPFKRLFKSTNIKYSRLVVVDKVNGGTKADAVNGGLNVVQNPYFINTDVDCILARDAIYHCIFPVLLDNKVIAVSGTMSMSNGCKTENGQIVDFRPPNKPLPLFQDLEYKRSFLVGKMGWSYINAMPNVSGGYGLFDTHVAVAAGGYGSDSFAEDMDMLWRMIGYCCDFKRDYRVVQVPHTCCWTEGPSTLKVLFRQRIRWGRGLLQLIVQHRRMLLNPRYKRLGMITFPYIFVFEFLAPIIELIGLITLMYLMFIGGVNWDTFWVILLSIYCFTIMISLFIVFYDYVLGGSYTQSRNYNRLVLAGMLEPMFYHPLIVLCSIRGYFNFIVGKRAVWGEMTRTGVKKKEDDLPDVSHTEMIHAKIEETGHEKDLKGGWGDRIDI